MDFYKTKQNLIWLAKKMFNVKPRELNEDIDLEGKFDYIGSDVHGVMGLSPQQTIPTEIESIINYYHLSCDIKNFKNNNKINWYFVSKYHKLSENFIEKFKDKVNWYNISEFQKLSEKFIEKFQNKVDWDNISMYQKLSEAFIERFKDKVDWYWISTNQKLSEAFIEKFKDKVDWDYISIYQKLSEAFIERFQKKVNWGYISKYQKLSEPFIERFKDYVDWYNISLYQKLSNKFIKKYNLLIPDNNTMYMTKKEINNLIPDCYQREGEYIIAYKNISTDRYSHFNFQYKYEKGRIYESHCDCNNNEQNSFGLSLWTEKKAKAFRDKGIVVRCRVKLEDVGAIVYERSKLRCKRIEVLT